jgi:hypothetical protein
MSRDIYQAKSFHPNIILDLPPGGLRTLVDSVCWLLSFKGTIGLVVAAGLVLLVGTVVSHASEKLLFPPGP